ncbi:hypothetical protein [uncultured Erythrobacter sp.]|uniref:hypothetical protein n=1 Tax=uncultured Erythrobacter sp. TaxID=263913 RepID=UPI00260D4CC7|nr:hypothetical protein [uncultured Erythrobacter sp.]
MIEIEVQNETHQTQERIRFSAVPRIGEGVRLREPDGMWASYDVLDVWYQKADYGDVWMPYLHICMTPGEAGASADEDVEEHDHGVINEGQFASLAGEAEPFKI